MINSTLTAYVFCIYKGNMIAVYKFKAVFRFMTPISYLKYLNRSRGRPFVKTSANWFWYKFNIYFAYLWTFLGWNGKASRCVLSDYSGFLTSLIALSLSIIIAVASSHWYPRSVKYFLNQIAFLVCRDIFGFGHTQIHGRLSFWVPCFVLDHSLSWKCNRLSNVYRYLHSRSRYTFLIWR